MDEARSLKVARYIGYDITLCCTCQTERCDGLGTTAQSSKIKAYEDYKKLVQGHMQPIVNMTKVLATEDDALFVSAYRALLPREFQTAAELSRLLMLPNMRQEQRDHRMLKYTSHGDAATASLRRPSNLPATAAPSSMYSSHSPLANSAMMPDGQLGPASGWAGAMGGVRSMAASGLSGAASTLSTHGGKALNATRDFSKKSGISSFFKFN